MLCPMCGWLIESHSRHDLIVCLLAPFMDDAEVDRWRATDNVDGPTYREVFA